MKELVRTKQFKKDVKRYVHMSDKMVTLLEVLTMLENEQPLPEQMRPHQLTGNYQGCMECHIGSDYLLIWMDENTNVIRLLRLGSHSELF